MQSEIVLSGIDKHWIAEMFKGSTVAREDGSCYSCVPGCPECMYLAWVQMRQWLGLGLEY